MAEFGVGVTDLGRAGFSGYIKQGVVDKSKAMGIESKYDFATSAIGYGMDKVKEYGKYRALKDVAEEIGTVMQEQEDRSYAGQAAMLEDQQKLTEQMSTVQNKVGYDGTYPTVLNQDLTNQTQGIQNELADKTAKLTRAREQGAMTEFELETRLAKITREAIARNPALAPEIMSHVGTVSNLNNLTAKVKQDADILKAQQEAQDQVTKALLKLAESDDINLNLADPKYYLRNGGFNSEALRQDIYDIQEENFYLSGVKRVAETKKKEFEINTQGFIQEGLHLKLNQAASRDIKNQMEAIYKNPSIKETDKIGMIKELKSKYLSQVRTFYGVQGKVNLENPEIKASLDDLKGLFDVLEGNFTESISKKQEYEILQRKNNLTIETSKQQIISSNPNIKHYLALNELTDKLPEQIGFNERNIIATDLFKLLSESTNTIQDENRNLQTSKYYDPNPELKGQSIAEVGLVSLASVGGTEELDKEFQKHIANIQNNPKVNKGRVTSTIIKGIANDVMTPEILAKLEGTTKDSLYAITQFNAQKPLKNALDRFIQDNPEAQLTVSEVDGRLMLVNNTGEYNDFHTNELRSINESFKAYHKLSGNKSLDKSVEQFYGNFLNLGGTAEKK